MNRFLAVFACDEGFTGLVAASFATPRERDAELEEGRHPDAVAVNASRDVQPGTFVQLANGAPVGAVDLPGAEPVPAYRRVLRDVHGATAVEYALIASLVAAASVMVLDGIGIALNATFMEVSTIIGLTVPEA